VLARRQISTDEDAPIKLEVKDSSATLKLNRPKIGNALDVDLQHALIGHLRDLGQRIDVRALVLTGEGKYFCTGMNLGSEGESLSGNNEEQHERRESVSSDPYDMVRTSGLKLISVVTLFESFIVNFKLCFVYFRPWMLDL
jgi:enoyl-CoA hydratase/carnithine racemase